MERFDDQLKRLAREEDAPLPDWAAGKLKELTGQKDQSLREPTAEELHPVKGPASPDAPVLK